MRSFDELDTIAASAGPPGPATRGLIRLTGPDAAAIARAGFEPTSASAQSGRPEAVAGRLTIEGVRRPVPATLVVWPGPRTYTGQPMAEVHAPGAPALVSAVLAHYLNSGARLAEPGEFTLRAFLSGRIDLTQAEAVLGVIDAASPARLNAALAQLAGGLSGPISRTRDFVLDALAHLEANLDFAEEPDVDELGRGRLADALAYASDQMRGLAERLAARDTTQGFPRVVLCGPPNAGKSRLFNALIGRERAIVSPIPGTTRDYLNALCNCDGLTVELVDTAGAEVGRDAIEAGAQSFRAEQFELADLRLDCVPADEPAPSLQGGLLVRTKSDLASREALDGLVTSAATGAGLNALKFAIARAVRSRSDESDVAIGTGARCRDGLFQAARALETAAETLCIGGGDELVAVDLRQAVDELGRVVGAVFADDILDRIFRRFCIGK